MLVDVLRGRGDPGARDTDHHRRRAALGAAAMRPVHRRIGAPSVRTHTVTPWCRSSGRRVSPDNAAALVRAEGRHPWP